MTSALSRFAFVDTVHAAEVLGVSTDQVLDWVREGTLKTYGGKPSNPFLRSADIAAFAESLGIQESEAPRRTKSASARVQPRLTSDSRWADVSEADIREWAMRADASRRQAARAAAIVARNRLELLLDVIAELERAEPR